MTIAVDWDGKPQINPGLQQMFNPSAQMKFQILPLT